MTDEEEKQAAKAFYKESLRRKPGPKPKDPEHIIPDRHTGQGHIKGPKKYTRPPRIIGKLEPRK